jgi:hypothetical protein
LNRTEHHTTLSELGFFFDTEDLPIINAYTGTWHVQDEDQNLPENYWVITTDGKGHNVRGHMSPKQILDYAWNQGWQVAYVAPYGHYVEGIEDGVKLHDWIVEGRRNRKHQDLH